MNSSDKKMQHDLLQPSTRNATPPDHELVSTTPQHQSADAGQRELQSYQLELMAQNESLREAKQALVESHDRYADLFELAPVGYLTLDEHGKITAVNRAGAELLGIERTALVGRSFAGFVTADDADRWHLHLVRVLKQDEKLTCELRLAGKDCTPSYVQADAKRMFRDGYRSTVQLILSDITQFKLLEFEIQQTQQLVHVGSWYWDAKTGDQVMSREMFRIFGCERIPPFPEQRGTLYAIETWECLNNAVQEAVQSGIGYDLELPALRGDGNPIWINTRCLVERDVNGDICGLRGTVQDITQRRQADERFHFQAKLLNAIGQAVVATDIQGTVTYMNGAAENLYGWPTTKAIGRSILEVTVPEVSQSQAIEIMGQLTAGRPWSGEFAVQHSGGRIFTAEVHDTPILDASGALIGIIGVSSDISWRKRNEQLLAQSEVRFATVVAALSEGVVVKGRDGAIVSCNPAAERIFGLTGDQLRGGKEFDPGWQAILEDGTPFPLDTHLGSQALVTGVAQEGIILGIRKPDSATTWISSNAVPIFHSESPSPSSVVVSFADITERKKAQEVILAASLYARSLLEASLDPLVTISAEGKITDVNKATEEVTGISRDKLIGSDFADYFTDPQKAREGYQQVFSQGSVTDFPLAIPHVCGKITDVLYNASVYRDAQGNVLGVFAAARDITQSKQMEHALRVRNFELEQAKAVAEEASLAKSSFLSSMSHELRTPLNAILGFAQLIESSDSPSAPEQRRSIEQILTAGWYLLELVNEILDLAQIESGKVVIAQEAVPLEHVMTECQALVEPLARKRGIDISFHRLDRPHYVQADPTRIRQVLINLLHNAIKYNKPAGSVSMTCTLSPPNSIRISVRDTGPGLSPEQVGQLFQPFNRLGKEAGPEQGTGIGLVVVKRLMELMGGSVGVDSDIGLGSVFWVELKLTTAPLPTMNETDQEVPANPKPSTGTAQRTVLYVEDNPANLALVEAIVARRKDLKLISAADANLGLEYARTYLPDVILMDIHLPGISGIEAMKVLRADPTTAHIPVIAVSAYALSTDIELALEAGFFNYLTKPIKLIEFSIALDVALKFSKREPIRAPTEA
jgi:PAS domain S-box-containing protein